MIPVFVINLPRSRERRLAITAHLTAAGIEPEFVIGVDGKELTRAEIKALAPRPYPGQERELSAGEIGCFLSHLRTMRVALERADRYFCVLEDDALVEPGIATMLDADHLDALLPRFDVLRLTRPKRYPKAHLPVGSIGGRKVVASLIGGHYATGQIYSREGAERIYNSVSRLIAPFDNMVFRDGYVRGLRILEVRPGLVRSSGSPSQMTGRPQPRRRVGRKILFNAGRQTRLTVDFVRAWGLSGLLAALRADRQQGHNT